ncbi:hypothetical protein HYT84_03715 [Candidatus Micrarchaeota archaeon]|nr:hypothetical protein [Candidatus Micrarchaeota archaeon]
MKGKNFFGKLSVLCLMLVVLAVSALAVPVELTRVEVNDVQLTPLTVNKLSVERGTQLEVEVRVLGLDDADNLELEAFLSGYEHNDVRRVAAYSKVFSVEKDELEVKKFTLDLPGDLEVDTYKLRLMVTDRSGDALSQSFDLKVDSPRHKLVVEDVLTYPQGTVRAGEALLVRVRVANEGEKDEENVKVTVSVPQLGLSQSTYLEEIEADEEEQTEELYLPVPADAASGAFDLVTEVSYNDGFRDAQPAKTVVNVVAAQKAVEPTPAPAQVTVQTTQPAPQPAPAAESSSKLRRGLEVVLLVLVALLVVVGLIIGFSKLKDEDEDDE